MITLFQKQAVGALRGAGLRPSTIRVRVLEYLAGHRTHPTADAVYSACADDLPTLSRTSVYNALNALESAGLARRLNIDDGEARFDAETREHGHFKCRVCGKVFDFDTEPPALPADLDGFKAEKRDVFVWGVCNHCVSREGTKNS
ncbi:MAG: transcriptional repressor [Clostridiales bacterium]|jgi:Fur family peroxide stress response transcriptional regulator|nr:transcriptional repressor [Clostridiales bacterium]